MFGKKKTEQEEVQNETLNQPVSENDSADQPEVKKEKKHSFLRAFTLLLSCGVLAFSFYCLSARIIDGNGNQNNINSYLTLTGKSVTESKNVYSSFGQNNRKKIYDYAFVGSKFFLSEYKITPNAIKNHQFSSDSTITDFSLYDLTNDTMTALSNRSLFSGNKFFIDFSKVTDGDYLIYPYHGDANNSKPDCYSLSDESSISYTIYTLPDSNGERRKVTFKNNAASPYSLFTVKSVGSVLPSDHYDAVLFYQEYLNDDGTITNPSEESLAKLESIQKSLSEETGYQVYVASSLEEAVNINATVSLCVSSTVNKVMTSLFTNTDYLDYETKVLSDTELIGYDAVPEIRECVGYLDFGGKGYVSVQGNSTVNKSLSPIGKEAFLLHDEKTDIVELLKQL